MDSYKQRKGCLTSPIITVNTNTPGVSGYRAAKTHEMVFRDATKIKYDCRLATVVFLVTKRVQLQFVTHNLLSNLITLLLATLLYYRVISRHTRGVVPRLCKHCCESVGVFATFLDMLLSSRRHNYIDVKKAFDRVKQTTPWDDTVDCKL